MFEDYLSLVCPEGKIYCFLDEVQFFPGWPIFVKAHYERQNVKFVITGSNSFLMSKDLLNLLSGRTVPVEVFPLSFGEILKGSQVIASFSALEVSSHRHAIKSHLTDYLGYGGFPEVALHPLAQTSYDILNASAKTILYQDVVARLGLKRPFDLEHLFYYLMSHIGVPFTYASLEKILGLTDKSIKEYLFARADALLLFEVDRFS